MNEILPTSESIQKDISSNVLLMQVLGNQEKIIKNQVILLKAERNRRIWGIVRIVVILLLIILPLLFLPMMMNSMLGDVLPNGSAAGFNLDAILGNPDALEQLLMGQ